MSDGRSRGFTAASIPDVYDRLLTRQLFEPLARELIQLAAVPRGATVLDVASGPGAVARLVAEAVGPMGRVVASDISAAMLGVAADKPVEPDWAPIEFAVCPVTAIEAADESFDAVFCQQGLQFFPDRTASLREMRRVLRPGGVVVVATWAAEHPLGLFGPMTEALREAGMEEPYPHAFDPESYSIGAPDLHQLLSEAKLRDVVVETVQLDALWASAGDAVETLMGTPYGPSVRAMPIAGQERVRALFARRLPRSPDGTVTIRTTSNVGRAFK